MGAGLSDRSPARIPSLVNRGSWGWVFQRNFLGLGFPAWPGFPGVWLSMVYISDSEGVENPGSVE